MSSELATPPIAESGNSAAHASQCFHCGEAIVGAPRYTVVVDGTEHEVCCPGCRAVAQAIENGGLSDYYRFRTAPATTGEELAPEFVRESKVYDHEDVQRDYVRDLDDSSREANLILGGIECAACLWLNERHLRSLPGVIGVDVNFATHRARIRWDPSKLGFSEILQSVRSIGYRAHPYDPSKQQALLDEERRQSLRRLGVAGALGMQVMMIAVALYAGDWTGMAIDIRGLFHWVSLFLTLPVLLYSGRPFLAGALRDVKNGRLGMDVPVSVGLGIAFLGSVHATVTGQGHVYYDSVVMFVFFLSLARYLEFLSRRRSAARLEHLLQPAPATATRLLDNADEVVPVAELRSGDRVLVRPGATIPADGRVLSGSSTVDEALLTGESRALDKREGDPVLGGSTNYEQPLIIVVERTGPNTMLAQILRLVDHARAEKPRLARVADRVAGYFVAGVLVLASAVTLFWLHQDPSRWLPITVAVLVVTCPCALSLAMPTALTAANAAWLQHGLVMRRTHALEALSKASRFVFDKTGTLTHGTYSLLDTLPLGELDANTCLGIAASLEAHSEHPIAGAFASVPVRSSAPVSNVRNTPGGGLAATIDETGYLIGSPTFIATEAGLRLEDGVASRLDDADANIVLLARRDRLLCVFLLGDRARPGARRVLDQIRGRGREVTLLSGDRPSVVRKLAESLGIEDHAGGLTPDAKLERIDRLRREGAIVAVIGDGLNDAPILASADVSIAMGRGAHAAKASADVVLLNDRLDELATGLEIARRTATVVVQNLTWAVAYNLIALPAAALGFVAPWAAALGMSLSSLIVVGNSLRLSRGVRD